MRLRRGTGAAAAVLVGVLLSGLMTTAGNAYAPDNTWMVLENWKYSWVNPDGSTIPRILAVSGSSSAPAGSGTVLWSTSHNSNGTVVGGQQWKRIPVAGHAKRYSFRSAGTSNQFALSINGNAYANGTSVVIWWYAIDNQFEQWDQIDNDYGLEHYRNVGTGKCLAVLGSSPSDLGAKIVIWDCGLGRDQYWNSYTPR
jgi:hypothetical protein